MENVDQDREKNATSQWVFEIPGEPAIVINGVPNIFPSNDNVPRASPDPPAVSPSTGNKGFGEWLEGREVRKLFGDEYYSGLVTEFDREAGWYRVVYEDGDFEDLDWNELEVVLQPLDIMVPLKSLALKTIKRSNKAGSRTVRSQSSGVKSVASEVIETIIDRAS